MKASDLFEKVLERPVLFVGKPSIPLIFSFIEGYCFGKSESEKDVRDEFYYEFNIWTAKRFNITTTHNWSDIIGFMGHSEAGAYDLAKKLWAEYKETSK